MIRAIYSDVTQRFIIAAVSLFCCVSVTAAQEVAAPTSESPVVTVEARAADTVENTTTPPAASETSSTTEGIPENEVISANESAVANAEQVDSAETVVEAAPRPSDGKLQFTFAGASWSDVLRWFAEEANLSLQMDTAPSGTVNFSDPDRRYRVSEGLDLLNRLLLDRGWAIVRRGRMLLLVDLEADNAEKLISEMAELVTPEEFDSRGNSDIVRAVFSLGGLDPASARDELSQIIGPWGRVTVLAGARQVIVTETIGKLRTIQAVLNAGIQAETAVMNVLLENRAAEEVLEIARPLLGLEAGQNASDSIRIAVSLFGDRIFATGQPNQLTLLQQVIEEADTPLPGSDDAATTEIIMPVLRTHLLNVADLQTTYDVLQTLLAGTPDTRLAIDANRGAIIASARPDIQTVIEQTIAELEGEGNGFATIDLKRLEPTQALLTINKFFGITGEETGNGPIVDGDPETGRLWVRGTSQQIEMVRKLIDELENDPLAGGLGDNVRILPLSDSRAGEMLDQLRVLWPLMGRSNRLRVISPSSSGTRAAPGGSASPAKSATEPGDDQVRHVAGRRETLVWQLPASQTVNDSSSTVADPTTDVLIQMTPAGLVIASQDQAALDMIEQLLGTLGESSGVASDRPTIFRLQYLKADVAAEMVAGVLGGADAGSSASSLTESVMGGIGGGMLGGLLGVGGGGDGGTGVTSVLTSRGSVNIVPDNRLNSLIVQATPADIDFIAMILEEIDREESPIQVRTVASPRLIPVIYQEASDVANIVKEVFAEKINGGSSGGGSDAGGRGGRGGGGGGAPSPQDFFAALRGGGGGGRGGASEAKPKSEPVPMIVAVDARSNSLIVTATPQDITMVEELVAVLDQSGLENEETVEVIPITGSMKPELLQEALESVLGKQASSTDSSDNNGRASSEGSNAGGGQGGSSADDIRARIEAFRARAGGGGGPFGGAGGGPFGGGGRGSGIGGGRPGGGGGGPGGGAGRGGGRGR
ncbi:MAG: secretin N-terminal domain-containing protein [Planctomycetota bacterium]